MAKNLKTGKKPAVYRPSNFQFESYKIRKGGVLIPEVVLPRHFGYAYKYVSQGYLGNDDFGDCVLAGADNETWLLNHIAGNPEPKFTADTALSDYSAITGFNRNDPSTDQGTVVDDAMRYRRNTGIVDADGKRHKIAAYVALEPGNLEQVLEAMFIFDAVGIGIEFPESAMDQFNIGHQWSVVAGSTVDGGHYVPLFGRPGLGYVRCVTWGRVQQMTEAFFKKYCDEAYAFITEESLNAKTQANVGGFDWPQLQDDLKQLPPVK